MIEIVSHCWSGDDVPIYHLMLKAQLDSLLGLEPSRLVKYTLFYAKEDKRTLDVINTYPRHPDIAYNFCRLDLPKLLRRSIGRHQAALETSADVVWFTDVDYMFRNKVLEQAYEASQGTDLDIVFPEMVMAHRNHAIGDRLLRFLEYKKPTQRVLIDPYDFVATSYKWAIGGIQIVKGDFCRRKGYAHRRLRLRPVDPSLGFQKCRGDADFRRGTNGSIKVPIEGVYRIRHSRCGRDKGTVDHSKGG